MATVTSSDESFVERDEVLFPNTDVIDTEPHYNNFTAIQNALRHREEHKQVNITTHSRSHSSDDVYRAIRTPIESSSLHQYHSNEMLYANLRPSANTFTVPLNIQSKKIDGHIFNLTQIIEDVGYNKNTPFMRFPENPNTKNVSALLNIVLKMGGAHGPLVNVWRSRVNNDYFQRWYLEKHNQRSASLIQKNTMSNLNEQTTQNSRTRDYHSNINIDHFAASKTLNQQMMNDKYNDKEVKKIFGYDDTTSSVSSYSPSNENDWKTNQQRSPTITSILKKNKQSNSQHSQTKHHVTIREHHQTNETKRTIPSQQVNNNQQYHNDYQQQVYNDQQFVNDYIQANNNQQFTNDYQQQINNNQQFVNDYQQTHNNQQFVNDYQQTHNNQQFVNDYQQQVNNNQQFVNDYQQKINSNPQFANEYQQTNNNQQVFNDYQQLIHSHPDVYRDPNPQIITKPNPDNITYQQNISVRYLVPPTPPPPGPLIIREIVPQRAPSPPPLIVKHQEPSPPTPPPLILREAPPPPPPHQETTVVTKILPPEPQPARRVIVEHGPPLPPKPQPIIIEKWLPYKPAPPREVIYERVTENQSMAEFETAAITTDRQRRHSAEFQSSTVRVPIPVNVQRRNSLDYIEKEKVITEQPSGTFDELAWTTHQQILAMQKRGKEQVQAHRQWAANQWQQHTNMFLQYPAQLATPSLVVYHQPVTRSYVQTQEYRQQVQYNPRFIYPFF